MIVHFFIKHLRNTCIVFFFLPVEVILFPKRGFVDFYYFNFSYAAPVGGKPDPMCPSPGMD